MYILSISKKWISQGGRGQKKWIRFFGKCRPFCALGAFLYIFRVILPILSHKNEIINPKNNKEKISYIINFQKKWIRATGGGWGSAKVDKNSLMFILLILPK